MIIGQRDEEHKDIKLGDSELTIGSHGCTVCCLAMLSGLTPIEVNDRLKAVGGFSGAKVIWAKISEALPLEFVARGYEYNNEVVASNLPCLVEVDGTRIGGTKHWVLYIGNQRMNDPWYGNEKATSYYKPLGYAIIKKVNIAPIMNQWENIKRFLTEKQVHVDQAESKIRVWWESDNKLLQATKEYETSKTQMEAKIRGYEEVIAEDHNWADVADSHERRLRALVFEMQEKGESVTKETEPEALVEAFNRLTEAKEIPVVVQKKCLLDKILEWLKIK